MGHSQKAFVSATRVTDHYASTQCISFWEHSQTTYKIVSPKGVTQDHKGGILRWAQSI